MNLPLISARGLGRGYPAHDSDSDSGLVTVLEAIDLDIERGEYLALTGPSGSGKSTLLHCLSGLDRPSSGVVTFDGADLARLSEPRLAELRRRTMGFVFQQTEFLGELTVLENILLPAYRRRGRVAHETLRRVEELMDRLDIADHRRHRPDQLSGGQRQRAGICRALVNRPAVLFADEPTGALHSAAARTVVDLFTELNAEGTTIVLVTHDPEVARSATAQCRLTDGRIERPSLVVA